MERDFTRSQVIYGHPVETVGPYSQNYTSTSYAVYPARLLGLAPIYHNWLAGIKRKFLKVEPRACPVSKRKEPPVVRGLLRFIASAFCFALAW